MVILLAALGVTAIVAPLLIKILGRPAFALLAAVPAGGFAWICSLWADGRFADGGAIEAYARWVPGIQLNLDFRMDALSAFFALIVLGVGALVLLYCWGYFDEVRRRLGYFGGYMVTFAGAMFGLVISNNFLLMYLFWEITSILSFLLVGYYAERASSRRAAGQALMVTTLGGLCMLVGIIWLGVETNIWTFSDLSGNATVAQTPYVTAAVVLILAGALSKSAIAPTHFWLPGAMAAPTPVSAYLHSAAMVKAGIYLVARLAPDFKDVAAWHVVLLSLGLFTMLLGGWMALKQRDLKLILAYGTVSQLGFLISVMGVGSHDLLIAGLALTVAHSLFKAALFMVVGAIDHATGTRNIRELSGLGRKQPILMVLAGISAASMAGIPPLFGFIAKEAALDTVLNAEILHGMPRNLMLVAIIVGSMLTMAYSLFFLRSAFATKSPQHPSGGGTSPAVENMHAVGWGLWLPPLILVCLTIGLGLYPAPIAQMLETHVTAVAPLLDGEHGYHLALWHGFTLPLLFSAIIIVGGIVIFWQRPLLTRTFSFEEPALGDANVAFDAVLSYLRRASLRLTASTQRGSLSINLATIFVVLIAIPMVSLLVGDRPEVLMNLWDTPLQAVPALVIIIVAFAATRQHNRLSAVIMVGVTGYCVAIIFAFQGAPDLALTQFLVETISMVVFMLVLRKLPAETQWHAEPKDARRKAWLAVAVGFSVTVGAMFAMNARVATPISERMPELAYEIGHGRNTVNVLLVDLRAWDTFGEITVLAVVAVGVASLIYRSRDFGRDSTRPRLTALGRRWLATEDHDERAQNRSLMVDIATRLLFPSMMALSMFFFFVGHNAPGGGFAGGLVAALAFTLRYLAGGRRELDAALPIDASKVMGIGLLAASAAALWPMFLGQPPLTTALGHLTLPLIGEIHVPSALLFDAGVYLVVIGVILHVLRSLGSQLDREEEMRKQRARDRARAQGRRSEAARAAARAKKAENVRKVREAREARNAREAQEKVTASAAVTVATGEGAARSGSPAGDGPLDEEVVK